MPRRQWLMQKIASWVLSLDLNLPSPSQGSAQQPAEHQACTHRPLCTTGVLTPAACARSSHELAF